MASLASRASLPSVVGAAVVWLTLGAGLVAAAPADVGTDIVVAKSLDQLLVASDLVVTGGVVKTEPLGREVGYRSGYREPRGEEGNCVWVSDRVTIAVEASLKGSAPSPTLAAWYARQPAWPSRLRPPAAPVVGQRYVFFLQRTEQPGEWALLYPNGRPPSLTILDPVAWPGDPQAETPLRRLMSRLVAAAAHGEPGAAAVAAYRLGEVGFLLHVRPNGSGGRNSVATVRRALEEPEPDLEDFVGRYILPALAAIKPVQPAAARAVLYARASLQDIAVIDELVRLIQAGPPVQPGAVSYEAQLLRGYLNPAAARALIPLVADGRAEVRQSAARALGGIGDRRAVPALVDLLADESRLSWELVDALAWLNGRNGEGRPDAFEAGKAQIVARWRDWAANHTDEIAKLRREADELLKPAAAPNP